MKSFNEVYKKIIEDLWFKGMETAPRGMKVKELLGYTFVIDPKDNVITLPGFETNTDYAKEELEWYYSGSNRIDFSPKIQKVWERYSDDGITVNSNYGHRVFGKKLGYINQWDWVKNKLTEDRDSRQAVININDITDKFNETKDFPCTMNIQAFIREDKLHWVVGMRSNDVYLGLRNDAYCFTEMQKKMADELNVGLGDYIHNAGSMHLYEKNYEKAKKLIGVDK